MELVKLRLQLRPLWFRGIEYTFVSMFGHSCENIFA